MLVVPAGQFVVPEVHGTLLVPEVMSWKTFVAALLANSPYSIGFTFPRPFDPVAWFRRATIPAKVGAPAEVPPMPVKVWLSLARKPFAQLVNATGGVEVSNTSCEQSKYESCTFDA